jgi:WD40 repeat protein
VIVLNVDRGADITKLVFVDADRVGAWASKRAPYRELPASLWAVTTGARVDFHLPGFAAGSFGQFRSGEWFLGSTTEMRGLIAHHPATGQTVIEQIEGQVGDIALTPDGKTVLFSWHNGDHRGYGSRTWSNAGAFGTGFGVPFVEGDGHHIVPLSDGARFVTLGRYWRNPHLTVRSVGTGGVLTTGGLAVFEQPAIAVAPDGKRLVAAIQLSLYVFSTDNLKEQRQTRKDGRKHFTAVAFHPSGKYLAATSNDTTVLLYDTTTWEVVRTFSWDIGRMRSIAFSPDGTLAAAGSDKGKVVVWDVDI